MKLIKISLKIIIILFLLSPGAAYCMNSYLDIVSDPNGVDIYINSEFVGKTPLSGLIVESGNITIEAKQRGIVSTKYSFYIGPDELKFINIPLRNRSSGRRQEVITLEPDQGSLIVINQLGEVIVSVDGEVKGKRSMIIEEIPTGFHKLRVGNFEKLIKIYKDYQLKVKCNRFGIIVMNDLDEIIEKRRIEAEIERKRREEMKEKEKESQQ